MIKKIFLYLLLIVVINLSAAVTVPAIFSDHAVLAKRREVPVFGTAAPGETVFVSLAGKNRTVTAGNDGKWMVKLDLDDVSGGPHILKINDLTFNDIMVGEVFLASGQSNMAFRLNRAEGYDLEKMRKQNNFLRCFNVAPESRNSPAENVRGQWIIATPHTVGNFSAVSYFFAGELQENLSCPVGIVNASVGGTEIECWMSKHSISRFPAAVKAGKKRDYLYESYPARYRSFLKKNREWEAKYKRIDNLPPLPPENAVWRKAKPPVAFGNGIWFLRTKINISAKDSADGFRINLMRCYTPMTLFIDGKRVASRNDESAYKLGYFTCNIPKNQVAPGTHEVILRYFVSHNRVRLPRIAYFGNTAVTEKGWEIFCGKDFGKPGSVEAKTRPRLPGMLPSRNRLWSGLYNGMISPLAPYKFAGVIWYQGESNESNAEAYRDLFTALIKDWRSQFGDPVLPFFFCQLAPYREKLNDPSKCGRWPLIRAAQSAALKLPGTGMAVLTDAGEALDIHPLNKKTPGSRLAKLALKHIYRKNITADAPAAMRATAADGVVNVEFSNCSEGLQVKALPEYYPLKRSGKQYKKLVRNSPAAQVEGFALCGRDGKWQWADKAEINGSKVVVFSAKVPRPVKIRFGWMENPSCNLYNKAGLPAIPFELSIK